MLKWNNYMVSNLYPLQLKEKKEKFETEQAKKKEDFKSGRIVGKASVNAACINSLQHTLTVYSIQCKYSSVIVHHISIVDI